MKEFHQMEFEINQINKRKYIFLMLLSELFFIRFFKDDEYVQVYF